MSQWSLWFSLVLGVLATWRLAHLLALEDGPFGLVVRLRRRLGDGRLGQMLDCPYCLSLWIAAPLALLLADSLWGWVIAWWAISGGASLLERLGDREAPASVAGHRRGE